MRGLIRKLSGEQHILGKHPVGAAKPPKRGGRWTISAMFVRFESAREGKIIRPEVVPYSYCHAWTTHTLENNRLDVYEVAKALGYQTTQMVMLHYDHSGRMQAPESHLPAGETG